MQVTFSLRANADAAIWHAGDRGREVRCFLPGTKSPARGHSLDPVLEDFGPLLADKRAESSPGQGYRLAYLHSLLGVDRFDDTIRYQLVQRTASALLTAREFHASVAVMLVHAFDTPAARRGEFEAFRKALSAHEIAPLVYHAKQFQGPALFLVWCDGDASFRNVLLPSVL